MIIDSISNAARYAMLHKSFKHAFHFLETTDLDSLQPGKYVIKDERIFALVQEGAGKGKKGGKLEVHRDYIDIQLCIRGEDVIGWKPAEQCMTVEKQYNASKDITFFSDKPETWLSVVPGTFAVFFPEDAHAPLCGVGEYRKIVIKVKLLV